MIGALLGVALAGQGWLLRTPEPELAGVVDVPLLRSAEDARPRVVASVGERKVLAVIDLLAGPSRVGWGPVYGAGLRTKRLRTAEGWITVARIPELTVGEAVFRDVRAVVGGDDDLVIGLAAVPGVEGAVLPSSGEVRLAPPGTGLVGDVGEAVPWAPQTAGWWWEAGLRRQGDGATPTFAGTLESDGAMSEGRWQLRTGLAGSLVAGGRAARGAPVRASLAGLEGTWWPAKADDRLGDPDEHWLGALGFDALAGVDLAVDTASRTAAWSVADDPRWEPAGELEVALEVLDDRRGEALWRAGRVEDALEASAAAAESGGCLPLLVLGMRRLRAGEDDPFGPLEEAMGAWTAWAALDREQRDAVRQGRRGVEDLGPEQPTSCAQATGRWLLARLAHGGDTRAILDDAVAYDDPLDLWTPLAGGVAAMHLGWPERAEPLLRMALHRGAGDEARVALAAVLVARDRPDQATHLLAATAAHPLLVAWITQELGIVLPADPRLAGALPARLIAAHTVAEADMGELIDAVGRARVATGGAAWTEIGLHLLDPDHPIPEQWTVRSPEVWVPWLLSEDPDLRAVGRAALAARFPEWWVPASARKGETPSGFEGQGPQEEPP